MRAIAASAARGRVGVLGRMRGRVLRAYQSSRDFGRWVLLDFLGGCLGVVLGWWCGCVWVDVVGERERQRQPNKRERAHGVNGNGNGNGNGRKL